MEMIQVQSSQIAEIGHDGASLLRVQFRRGGLYEYSNVSANEFAAMRSAQSIGSHFAQHIKGRKPFAKVEATPVVVETVEPKIMEAFAEPPQHSEPGAPDPERTQTVSRKSTELTAQATQIAVNSSETQQRASDVLLSIAAMRKEIADTFKPMKDAAFKAHRTICDQERSIDAPLLEAEKALKFRIGSYVLEQQRIAHEAEEALRKAEMERAQAAAAAEAEEAALNDAIALEEQGDIVAAQNVLANPAPAPVRYNAPAPIAPQTARVAGVSTRTEWDFCIVNENLIPREYLSVNESAIRAVVKRTKGKVKIAGIECFPKAAVAASRTAKSA